MRISISLKKIPDNNDLLNKDVMVGVRMNAHSFKNSGEISSGPILLFYN